MWGLLAAFLGFAFSAWGEPPEIALELIAKARERLGGDAALEKVHSLRYEGVLDLFESSSRAQVRLVLAQPARQRMEVETADMLRIFAVDDLQGWEMVVDKSQTPPVVRLRPLSSREFWRNHFSAVENLGFHHGYLRDHGRLEWGGQSVFEGRLVGEVRIRYDEHNAFVRRFDLRSGDLIVSTGNDGTEVREREWIEVDGVRFPQVTESYRDGERVSRLSFDVIEVNPETDPAWFRFPDSQ